MTPDDEETWSAIVRTQVWCGFYDADEIREQLALELELEGLDPELLDGPIADEIEKKRRAEATWPAVTDCDRLDAAFAELAKAGVLALHNPGVTMSSCVGQVQDAFLLAPPDVRKAYCFYHWQDVEYAMEGRGLWIAFGDLDGPTAAVLEIGRMVKAALEKHGLAVTWIEHPDERIVLKPFDWKRRYSLGLSTSPMP